MVLVEEYGGKVAPTATQNLCTPKKCGKFMIRHWEIEEIRLSTWVGERTHELGKGSTPQIFLSPF